METWLATSVIDEHRVRVGLRMTEAERARLESMADGLRLNMSQALRVGLQLLEAVAAGVDGPADREVTQRAIADALRKLGAGRPGGRSATGGRARARHCALSSDTAGRATTSA